MNTNRLLNRMRNMRIVVVLLVLLLGYGAVAYSPQAATPIQLYSVNLGGVTGVANNTALAFDRFLLVAPFWPSTGVDDNGKPILDTNVIPIDIKAASTDYASEAPLDFALNGNGKVMVFTNGASIFWYDLSQGYLNEKQVAHPNTYGPNDSISFLDID